MTAMVTPALSVYPDFGVQNPMLDKTADSIESCGYCPFSFLTVIYALFSITSILFLLLNFYTYSISDTKDSTFENLNVLLSS